MDPVLATIVEFWWIGPSVIGAGALGWVGLRSQRSAKARRLAYDASREAVRAARHQATAARISVRVAKAELTRLQAERAAGRASAEEVKVARRALDTAQRETKAAAATARARRAALSADRAALGARSKDPAHLPLARLMAADDAITARWMEYETDPARAIAFPTMSDARTPATAIFLAELRATRALRPETPTAPMTPAEFNAYRDGVARLTRAFEAAEADAWHRARGTTPEGAPTSPAFSAPASEWMTQAHEIAQSFTSSMLARGAEALTRMTAPKPPAEPSNPDATEHEHGAPPQQPKPAHPHKTTRPPSPAPDTTQRVWPIPSRDSHRP